MPDQKPWWENKRAPVMGNGALDADWACTALAEDALKNGLTVYENSLEGSAKITLEELAQKFMELGGRLVFSCPLWRGDTTARQHLIWDSSYVSLWATDGPQGDLGARFISTDPLLFKKAQELIEESIGPKASSGRVYVLMTTSDGPKLKSLGTAAVPLERDNYDPDVLEDFDAVVDDLKSSDPSGRLAIFDGVPGTGKTFMMKGLLAAVPDALFVLVPVSLVSELASPGMIGALLETRHDKGDLPTVFVIEDADECLGSRDSSNVNSVSALLNLSDGIIGALMDIRLVCSTNLRNEELDEAVVREGRLSRKVHVGTLRHYVAEKLFEKLTGKKIKIDEKLTLAQVYGLAREDGWKPVVRKRRLGFSSDPMRLPGSVGDED
jgi:hypothetical protein